MLLFFITNKMQHACFRLYCAVVCNSDNWYSVVFVTQTAFIPWKCSYVERNAAGMEIVTCWFLNWVTALPEARCLTQSFRLLRIHRTLDDDDDPVVSCDDNDYNPSAKSDICFHDRATQLPRRPHLLLVLSSIQLSQNLCQQLPHQHHLLNSPNLWVPTFLHTLLVGVIEICNTMLGGVHIAFTRKLTCNYLQSHAADSICRGSDLGHLLEMLVK